MKGSGTMPKSPKIKSDLTDEDLEVLRELMFGAGDLVSALSYAMPGEMTITKRGLEKQIRYALDRIDAAAERFFGDGDVMTGAGYGPPREGESRNISFTSDELIALRSALKTARGIRHETWATCSPVTRAVHKEALDDVEALLEKISR